MKQFDPSNPNPADKSSRQLAEEGVFSLTDFLRMRASRAITAPKRHRTRLALLAATAEQMETVGYQKLTIEGIVKSAGLARGTFYLHYKNRSDAAWAVRRSYLGLMRSRRPKFTRRHSTYQKIYGMNLFYLLCCQANAQILSGQDSLMHDRPELSRSRDFLNHRFANIILRDLARQKGLTASELVTSVNILGARFIIGMADEALREIYVKNNPYLHSCATDVAQVAEALSVVWFRALLGEHPKEGSSMLGSIVSDSNQN
jgi:AcrR family transcriptional regulator